MKGIPGTLLAAVIGVAGVAYSAPSAAELSQSYSNRAGRFETTLQVRYVDSRKVGFDGGASADMDSAVGFGFGFGYNFNQHLAMHADFSWASIDYQARGVDSSGNPHNFSGTLDTSSGQLNVTYYILPGKLTPFVAGGLGYTWVDTNIASGPPASGCYWDPWWGYVCYPYQPTYSTSEFSYNAALGLRWDVATSIFLRASIGKQWIDFDNTSGTPSFTLGRFDIGFMF